MSLLSSSSTTVSITPHICLRHPCCTTSLPCFCLRHICTKSLLVISPLSQILPWPRVCFTSWNTVAVAAIPPPIHQTRHCHCCRYPVYNMVVKIISVTYIILSLYHWCPYPSKSIIQSSYPVLVILILHNHYLHFPVSLLCLLFRYLCHPCISTAAVLDILHILFHFHFYFPASMPPPSLSVLIVLCISHWKPHNLL